MTRATARTRARLAAIVCALIVALAPSARADHDPPDVDVSVDTFADSYDGSCGDGDCSLRDAVESAAPGEVIGLPPGVFQLTRVGSGGAEEGDVDVTSDVSLVGTGDTGSFVASPDGDRAFHVSGAVTVTFERITVIGGPVGSRGGGIAIDGGAAVHLDLVTISNAGAPNGGAIAVTGSSLELDRSSLVGNDAERRGGGISVHGSSTVDVDRSTIADGEATSGGAVWTERGSTLSVTRSTLARNAAEAGGAIFARGATAPITSATIARNAAQSAAAMVIRRGGSLEASLVAGNRSEVGRPCVGDFRSGGNVGTRGTGSCGFAAPTNVIVRDAGIGPLAGAGGATPTIPLEPGSPAIDAGPTCAGVTDQRGVPRDRRCDAGAYEFTRCEGAIVNVVGTRHDDELSGGRRADGMLGLGGDDQLQGSIGSDGICGDGGRDRLLGGPGPDRIDGGPGRDRIRGERGDDRLRGGGDADLLIGGPGRDTCLDVGSADRIRSCEVVRRTRG
jgi:CSLREA domain-containing protein